MNMSSIIFLSIVGIFVILYLIDRFTGRSLTEKVVQWKPTLTALSMFVEAFSATLPSPQFKMVSVILRAASDATQEAENLYKLNQLPKNERNEYAQLLIADALKKGNVQVTDQVQEIIDGCIALVCMLLPHENKNENTSDDIDVG